MPAKRKTKQDRLREAFAVSYKVGKARSGLRDSDVAGILGITPMTFRKKRNDPKDLKAGELATLAVLMKWDITEVSRLIELMQ